jgi:hypothetical protein
VEFAIEFGRNITSEKQGEKLDSTTWNLEILSAQCIEAERADDDGCKL